MTHDPDLNHLLDLGPTAVTWLRRSAFAIAFAAVVLSFIGKSMGWLDYKPGGTAFDLQIRPVFTAIFVVSLLLALKWELAGGVLATFVGAALVAFAVNQLVTSHAIIVTVALLVPALLWILVDLNELAPRTAMIGLGAVVVAAVLGLFSGQQVYAYFWGPTHPESTVEKLDDSLLTWVWSGSISTTGAEVRAKPAVAFDSAVILVSERADRAEAVEYVASDVSGGVIGFELDGLRPGTGYHYAIALDGEVDDVRSGRFTTFPEGPSSYRIAIGSCARVGANGRVFDAIRDTDPLLYLITGDLHYGDNGRNDIARYQEVMDLTLSLPAQAALYRSTPIAYMWDDHDYGGNDSDGSSVSRAAAMAAYREYVPSYDLSGDESAIYQAFTVGRVRYLLTDARSARDLDNDEKSFPSMLGSEQRAWLMEQMVEGSRTHELVVWVNPVPWIAAEEEGADHWGGYAEERRLLADHIAENEIDNLLMVSGDAHMVAIDDGTNTDYSTSGHPGFPLVHAAALDRPGSIKGGPYSEGAIDGPGQFVTMDIDDNGNELTVKITAFDWTGAELMAHEFRPREQ